MNFENTKLSKRDQSQKCVWPHLCETSQTIYRQKVDEWTFRACAEEQRDMGVTAKGTGFVLGVMEKFRN